MTKITETKQYEIDANEMISSAFYSAYSKYADAQEAAPPDTATLICTCLSMAVLIAVFVLTALRYTKEKYLWFAMCAIVAVITAYFIHKYIKERKAFLAAAGKPDTVNIKKNEFLALFGNPEELTGSMHAADLQTIVRKNLGKQNDTVLNSALKNIADDLVRVNNPDLPACRLVTTLPEAFSQPRARLYLKKEGGKYIFFDQNWDSPEGQLECEEDDILSYGKFTAYPASINTSGGKIRPESGIVELAGPDGSIYVDFVDTEFEKALKLLPRRKEKKQS